MRTPSAASAQLVIGAGALSVAPAIAGILAARTLGPTGRGELAVALSLATIAGSLGMRGLDVALLSVSRSANDAWYVRRLVRRRGALVLPVEGMVAGIVACIVLGSIEWLLVSLIMILAGMTTLFLLVRSANLALNHSRRLLRADLCAAGTMLAGAVVVSASGANASAFIASSVVGLAVGVLVGDKRVERPDIAFVPGGGDIESLRLLGRSAWIARGFQATAFRLDRVVLAWLAGPASAGIYAAVIPFAEMTTILQLHLAQLATAEMSRTKQGVSWYRLRTTQLALGSSAVLCVLVLILADPLISVFYGEAFSEGVPALRILALASFVSVCWRFSEAELFARQHRRGAPIATAVAAAIVIGGTAALYQLGAMGASIASLIGYAAGLIGVLYFLKRDRNA